MSEQYQPAYVPHDDLAGDARERLLQALATLSTVGEAGARWAAVGIQNRAAEREQQTLRDEAAAAARREADKLAGKVRDERQRMADTLDGDWLTERASLAEAAQAWRTATVHATTGDPVAAKVARLAEMRLRLIRPDLMSAYDTYTQPGPHGPGMSVHEAMRAAVRDVWETDARHYQPPGGSARPHGNTTARPQVGTTPRALPSGGQAVDELDRQVRHEAAQLAEHISPAALDELQRTWRERGQMPPIDPTDLLRAYLTDAVGQGVMQLAVAETVSRELDAHAAAERANGRHAAGTTDDPATTVNEHAAGQADSSRRDDNADQTEAAAAALRHSKPRTTAPAAAVSGTPPARPARPVVAEAFPGPLRIGAVHPAVAGKQPAKATTARTHGRAAR